jgi:hypothetical protein
MKNKTIKLTVVQPLPNASILTNPVLPILRGNEPVRLTSGKCSAVLSQGVSTEQKHPRDSSPPRCKCCCAVRAGLITVSRRSSAIEADGSGDKCRS